MVHRTWRQSLLAVFTLGFALVGTAPADAQDVDGRWMAFLGCWELEEAAESGILCVQPTDDGVELFTIADGEVATSDLMLANGQRRETSVEGCEGWESAEFSQDGRRLFTHAEFVCGGEIPRSSTGIMSLIGPTEWLDVRSVDVDGEQVAWVQRYRLVGPDRMAAEGVDDFTLDLGMTVRTARMAAGRAISVDDVEEAAEAVDSKAVEAWVAARGERFDIDAEELVRLADAGMPEGIIDVMVAVTYPETFAIDPEMGGSMRGQRMASSGPMYDRYGMGTRGYTGRNGYGSRSFFWDPFYYGYSPYRSGFGYGYGYGSAGYPLGGYYYTPTTVVITERTSEDRARVVNGRGYTQGRGSGSAGARRAGTGSGGGASAAPSRSSGGSSAGSAGTRSGGSSGTTRKAKPRGGRGG